WPHADLADVPRPLLRLGEGRDRELQLDRAEPIMLHGPYYLKPDQLEERKEGHDDLPPPRLRREDLRKFDPASEGETGQSPGGQFGSRKPGPGRPWRRRGREPGQPPAHRVQEIRQAGVTNPGTLVARIARRLGLPRRGEDVAAENAPVTQVRRGFP